MPWCPAFKIWDIKTRLSSSIILARQHSADWPVFPAHLTGLAFTKLATLAGCGGLEPCLSLPLPPQGRAGITRAGPQSHVVGFFVCFSNVNSGARTQTPMLHFAAWALSHASQFFLQGLQSATFYFKGLISKCSGIPW